MTRIGLLANIAILVICFHLQAGIRVFLDPGGVQALPVYRGCYPITDYQQDNQGREWIGLLIDGIDKPLYIKYDYRIMKTYRDNSLHYRMYLIFRDAKYYAMLNGGDYEEKIY